MIDDESPADLDRYEELVMLRSEVERLRAALTQIVAIDNKDWGPDWEEIEEARDIARAALEPKP